MMAQSLPIDTLLTGAESIVLPDEQLRDRIHFIINNVSQMNLDTKAQDLKKILKPEHYAYLAQYLVLRRVSIEANFHQVIISLCPLECVSLTVSLTSCLSSPIQLYLSFLDKLNLPELNEKVVNATYSAIKSLLSSEKIRVDISERSLLKNLGIWLGMMTMARNKAILDKQLPLKVQTKTVVHENRDSFNSKHKMIIEFFG